MLRHSLMVLLGTLLLFSCTQNNFSPGNGSYDNSIGITGNSGDNINPAGGDQYGEFIENPFIKVSEQDISTFSVDADGASYANIRRFIQQDNNLPPNGAVRTEEMINYFDLDYPHTNSSHPISLNGEVSHCPWKTGHKLIRIGIEGREIPQSVRPPSNFVFLIDVSGSMNGPDRLDLLKEGFKRVLSELNEDDRVAIVTYAGSAGVALGSTPVSDYYKIRSTIESLEAGGSTAGADGIRTAYEIAEEYRIDGGNNRVILGTDGGFNVGVSNKDSLVALIEEKRELGIFLTVLGVGRGNLNDAALEQIADNGNGTYEYIDKEEQLEKVFIHDYSKFFTVAKDVKVQVQFNEEVVEQYRLIGYANRILEEEDFEDDEKDAGEIGADQNITALYEIKPQTGNTWRNQPTFTIKFRYKEPDAEQSIPLEMDIHDEGKTFDQATDYMHFTAGIASWSMLMTDSDYKGESSYDDIKQWLNNTDLEDAHGFKQELIELVERSESL